ncbi:MAG: ABC transporter ATP-binding protein [Bacillota bacterium]|nr:ABC transporter ATP-binding protein [Bacillota bacterium]
MGELTARAIHFTYPGAAGGQAALAGVSVTIAPGEFVGLIGPNGSGKTTFLRCLTGLLAPQGGAVLVDGRDVHTWGAAELAKRLGVVAQGEESGFAFTVRQVVAMGRYPHRRRWQRETPADREAVAEALQSTGLAALAERPVSTLSGGERQRVVLARALAQTPRILLLDEVTAHLDVGYQAEILALLQRLHTERRLTIVAVLHDLNLAARCCQRLVLLANGRVVATGSPLEVLTPANLQAAYGVRMNVNPGRDGQPLVTVETPAAGRGAAPRQGTVHLICGGGSGTALIGLLTSAGYQVSCGVLNRGDSDWETARLYQLEVAEEAPFSAIEPAAHAVNLALIRRAAAVVMGDVPFGPGNLANLRAAREALAGGRPVFVCDFTPIAERDFTGGEATREYEQLLEEGAVRLSSEAEVLSRLDGALPRVEKERPDKEDEA